MTEAAYLRTSFPDVDREFLNGDVKERSVPDLMHSRTVLAFTSWFLSHGLGCALSELRIRVASGQYRIPDLAVFWPAEPAQRIPEIAPFITLEVLSPDERLSDLRRKLADYHAAGVRHVWMADPETATFSVYDGKLRDADALDIPELGLSITAADIFRRA